jgi:hypothetical protein
MIDFNSLEEREAPKPVKNTINRRGEYIIGFDPFEQEEEKEEGVNVFIVYSRYDMRVILRCKTKKTFDWFVEFVKRHDVFKQSYYVSTKFINNNGKPKTISEIRDSAVRLERLTTA